MAKRAKAKSKAFDRDEADRIFQFAMEEMHGERFLHRLAKANPALALSLNPETPTRRAERQYDRPGIVM